MRIAWITPYLPFPANSGGRIRMTELARASARSHHLTLYSLVTDDETGAPPSAGASVEPWSEVVTWRARPARSLRWLTPGVVSQFPPGMRRRLEADHRARKFDAVVLEHCFSGAVLPLPGAAVVLDEHNVESAYARRAFDDHANIGSFREWVEVRSYERALWRKVDAVAVVTSADAETIVPWRRQGATVIPNGVALDRYRFIPPSRRGARGVLFVGHLGYPPNVRAACTLARAVLPRLREFCPDATLTLAGRSPCEEVRALAGSHVRITGTLDDVSPIFDEHGVYAMPLDLGAGSSLKVLEPLAAGLPLVASQFAVRGFDLRPNLHYLQAEGVEETVMALRRVLTKSDAIDEIAERGRRVAEAHGWARIGARFVDLLDEAARRAASRAGDRP